MKYLIYGPFKLPRDHHRIFTRDAAKKNAFWNEVDQKENGLADACGCYVKQAENKAIKVLFERHCSEIAGRLIDVENHMEGAFEDWIRFIRQNCEGSECSRIWQSLLTRKANLARSEQPQSCGDPVQPSAGTSTLSCMRW